MTPQKKIRPTQAIPPKGHSVYPTEGLKIGESFIAGEYSEELVNRVNASNAHYEKKLNRKFCIRKEDNYLSVWREE